MAKQDSLNNKIGSTITLIISPCITCKCLTSSNFPEEIHFSKKYSMIIHLQNLGNSHRIIIMMFLFLISITVTLTIRIIVSLILKLKIWVTNHRYLMANFIHNSSLNKFKIHNKIFFLRISDRTLIITKMT